jgi:chromosome segregation ATPase
MDPELNQALTVVGSIIVSTIAAVLTYLSQRPKLKAEAEKVHAETLSEIERSDEMVFQRMRQELDRRFSQLEVIEGKVERLQNQLEQEKKARLELLEEERKRVEGLTKQLLQEKGRADELAAQLEIERNLRKQLNQELTDLRIRVVALEEENAVLRSVLGPKR